MGIALPQHDLFEGSLAEIRAKLEGALVSGCVEQAVQAGLPVPTELCECASGGGLGIEGMQTWVEQWARRELGAALGVQIPVEVRSMEDLQWWALCAAGSGVENPALKIVIAARQRVAGGEELVGLLQDLSTQQGVVQLVAGTGSLEAAAVLQQAAAKCEQLWTDGEHRDAVKVLDAVQGRLKHMAKAALCEGIGLEELCRMLEAACSLPTPARQPELLCCGPDELTAQVEALAARVVSTARDSQLQALLEGLGHKAAEAGNDALAAQGAALAGQWHSLSRGGSYRTTFAYRQVGLPIPKNSLLP